MVLSSTVAAVIPFLVIPAARICPRLLRDSHRRGGDRSRRKRAVLRPHSPSIDLDGQEDRLMVRRGFVRAGSSSRGSIHCVRDKSLPVGATVGF